MRRAGRRRRVAAVALGLVAVLVAAAGCATARFWLDRPPRVAGCDGPLADVAALPDGDFLLRERVHVRGGEVDTGFELVAERRGATLVVVGLNAFGAKSFSITQRGREAEAVSHLGPTLPLPPESLLRDLHAARFLSTGMEARVEVSRPGCDYTATFVRVERRPLP